MVLNSFWGVLSSGDLSGVSEWLERWVASISHGADIYGLRRRALVKRSIGRVEIVDSGWLSGNWSGGDLRHFWGF
jgi:hypothetical protein